MGYIAFPNTAQVMLNWRLNGEQVQNNLFIQTPTGWSVPSLSNLAAAMFDWVDGDWLPLLSADIYLDSIVCIDRETSTGGRVEVPYGSPFVGTDAGDAVPNQIALVMSFLTEQRGRAYRGRNYIAGLADGHIVNGIIIGVTLTAWQAVFANMDTYFGAADWNHVVASASLVNPTTGGTGFVTPVTTYRPQASPGVRRSRRMP